MSESFTPKWMRFVLKKDCISWPSGNLKNYIESHKSEIFVIFVTSLKERHNLVGWSRLILYLNILFAVFFISVFVPVFQSPFYKLLRPMAKTSGLWCYPYVVFGSILPDFKFIGNLSCPDSWKIVREWIYKSRNSSWFGGKWNVHFCLLIFL